MYLQAKKAMILKDETFPKFLGYFESLLIDNGSTGFFVGNTVSKLVYLDTSSQSYSVGGDGVLGFYAIVPPRR